MVKKLRVVAAISASFALTGCNSVGPDFLSPDSGLPNRWFTSGAKAASANSAGLRAADHQPVDPAWWQSFHDATLTSLVQRVANANLDVRTATVRLAQSRFQRRVVSAAGLPTLGGSANFEHQKFSDARVKGSVVDSLTGFPDSKIRVPAIDLFTSAFDASWELDLWGRVRRQVESADAQVQYSEEQRRDALISSLAETARNYIELRGTQTLIKITKDNVKIQQDILQLTRDRQEKGLTTGLDVENAAAQVESVLAQLPSLEQQEAQQINALSFFLDLPPDALRGELATGKLVVPRPARVPIGIPSELARRRPDIRSAEAQLHAATADIGVATADFYPSVQLSGSAGFDFSRYQEPFEGQCIPNDARSERFRPDLPGGPAKSDIGASQSAAAGGCDRLSLCRAEGLARGRQCACLLPNRTAASRAAGQAGRASATSLVAGP